MSRYVTIYYHRNSPQVRMQHTLNDAAPAAVTPPEPPTGPFDISGTITSAGTGGAYEITANGTAWYSAASGSYGYTVDLGFSGSTVPTWVSDPPYYTYISVAQNYTNQNFDIPVPFLTYAVPFLDWSSWAYTSPDHWAVQAQNPNDLTWSVYTEFVEGVISEVTDFGTYYRVVGHTSGDVQITPYSNQVLAEPPDVTFTISGAITYDGTNPLENAEVRFEFDGTAITDANGSYAQDVPEAYSGTAIPFYSSPGTFTPEVRVYTNVQAHTPGQDYVFVFTGTGSEVFITLSGSVYDSLTSSGLCVDLWVDTIGTISAT